MHVCVARRLNKAGGLKPFQQADPRDYLLQIVYALSEAFDQDSLSMRETQLRTAVQREDREADVTEAVSEVTASYLKKFAPAKNPIASTFLVHATVRLFA